MTPAQARRAYQTLTEVQMILGDLPKSKALKAYNKLEKTKLIIKKSQSKKYERTVAIYTGLRRKIGDF